MFLRFVAYEAVMRTPKLVPSISAIVGAGFLLSSCAAIDNIVLMMEEVVTNLSTPKFATPKKGDFTAIEDEQFSLSLEASDDDLAYGDKLAFTADELPNWLYLSRDGVLEGMPKNQDVGIHDIRIRVVDLAGQFDELDIQILVENSNDAPVILNTNLEFATQGDAYNQLIEVEDDDLQYGDTLSFSALTAPEWLDISSNGMLVGTPLNADVGVHKVTIEVMDAGGLSAQQNFIVEVKNVNDAPIFLTK